MRYSLVSSKKPAYDVLVDSLSAHTNTPETEACMFRRAFVHAFCLDCTCDLDTHRPQLHPDTFDANCNPAAWLSHIFIFYT